MATFNSEVRLNVSVANERSLDRVAATVGRISSLAKQIKPINLFAPGAGAGADQVRVAMEKILDRAQAISKEGSTQLSATFAGAAQTASAFDEVMRNVNIKVKNGNVFLDDQSQKLQDIARAFALATQKAQLLEERYASLRKQALGELGIDVPEGPASRLDSPESAFARQQYYINQAQNAEISAIDTVERLRETKSLKSYNTRQRRIRYLAKLQEDLDEKLEKSRDRRRARRVRAEEQAAREAAKGLENILLGAGFPLLFGGGAGAVGGGLLGSIFGDGFGGQIFVGAIGQQIDTLVQSSIEFAQAFREGGDAAGALTQALGYLNPEVSSLISNLQRSGQTAEAAAVAQSELAKVVGDEGAKALRDTGEDLDQYQRSIKQLGLQFYAAAQSASRFFQSLRGDYGQIPGLAPPVEEAPVSQAARDREAALQRSVALREEEARLSAISRTLSFQSYTQQQKIVAQKTLSNEKSRIETEYERGNLTAIQKKLELKLAEIEYNSQLNKINKEITERNAQEAKRAAQEAERAAKERERVEKALAKQQKATEKRRIESAQLVEALMLEVRIAKEQNELQKIGLNLQLDQLLINQEYDNLLRNETDEITKQNLALAETLALQKAIANTETDKAKLGEKLGSDMAKMFLDISKQNEKLTDTDKLYKGIYETVASDLSQGIQGLIQGTTTLNDIASQLLSKLGGLFLDAAFSGLGKSLKIPGFADGGVPPVGKPSIVGEKGPELFVPGQQGLVVPNDIFNATRDALSAGGGTSEAFSDNSEALAVANSYTRERMFERERQTMMTGAGGSTTVQTQVINSVEYATIDQVQQVADLSAKKARAQVFSDMRNRPATRASLGMA